MNNPIPPYSLVMIKPLTIGRQQGPAILTEIMYRCPVSLRFFREWEICPMTWRALYNDAETADANVLTALPGIGRRAWICLFTHKDRITNPWKDLVKVCGAADPDKRGPDTIKEMWKTPTSNPHKSDTVIHLSDPYRTKLEADLLLYKFNELDI